MNSLMRLAVVSAVLAVSSPVTAFELVNSGDKITLGAAPTHIVSYDLAVLDSLNTLDIPVVGVPKSTYQNELAKFNELPQVGSLFEPDYEALRPLKPDLIFAGGRSQNAIPELAKLAPTASYVTGPTEFLDDFRRNNLALAAAFGKTEQASQAIDVIDKNVVKLHKINEGKTGAFLFVIRDRVIPHVPGDRFGYAYDLAGLRSVLPAKDPNMPAAPRPEPGSPEAKAAAQAQAKQLQQVADADPDWLVVLDRGAIGTGEKTAQDTVASHPVLSQTEAVKAGRVIYIDPNRWYLVGAGLTNLRHITEELLTAMADR